MINKIKSLISKHQFNYNEQDSSRATILLFIQITIIGLLIFTTFLFIFLQIPNELFYLILSLVLIITQIVGLKLNFMGRYHISVWILIISCGIIQWISAIFDEAIASGDIVPLVYSVLIVLLASILLTMKETLFVSILQFLGLIAFFAFKPTLLEKNVTSLFVFYLFIVIIFMINSFVVKKHIKQLNEIKNDLKESENRYRGLFNNLGAGIIVHGPDTQIISSNSRASEILRLSEDQLRGKQAIDPVWKFVNEDMSPLALEEYPINHIINHKKTIKNRVLGICYSKSNNIKWVHTNGVPIFNEEGNLLEVVISFIDITESKSAEKAIEESEARHKAMVAGISDVIGIIDANSIITYKSPNIERDFGWKPEELIGTNTWQMIHPEDVERIQNVFYALIQEEDANSTFECRYKCKDGSYKWIKLTAVNCINNTFIKGVLINYHDITEIKMIELALRESEIQLQRAIYEAPVPIMLHAEDGEVIKISSAWTELTGYTHEDVPTTKLWAEKAYGIKQDEVYSVITTLYNLDKKQNEGEFTVRTKSGKDLIWDFYSAHIGTLTNGRKMAMSVAIDITERKSIEDELIIARKNAEKASFVKSQFLANMSHEIRTPLNGILGMIELTLLTEITSEQRENLTVAKTSSNTLLTIINDILDYTKIQEGKLVISHKDIVIRELFSTIKKLYLPSSTKKGIRLTVNIDENVPNIVTCDEVRLVQILSNLLGNAIKFTNEGFVNVRLKLLDLDEETAVLRFCVKDSGIGIPNNRKEELFKRFSQLDSSITKNYGGTGLGLAISKNLVELLQGSLEFKSVEGEGSSFWFDLALPYSSDLDSVKRETKDISILPVEKQLKNILVVEDDVVNQKLMGALLKREGYDVQLASNGLEGLNEYKNNVYNLVFMDVSMPIMDGYEAVKLMKKSTEALSQCKIVAMTAFALGGDKDICLEHGYDDYISKPIDFDKVYKLIEKYS